ncbi:hypothetical protein [Nocardiopsis rhodophaea]|uniref:hypothetical protein n=1 Tax=Nocardiopsis rhodophaea TaxID=280238 RepID=UPI0031E19212
MATGTYEYQTEFARKHYGLGWAEGEVKGKVEGQATALLFMLDARGICLTDGQRELVVSCTDLDRLQTWIARAATATTAEQVFG